MLALIATGFEKFTCCHPDALSPVKVAVASSVPVLFHRCPRCVPVLFTLL